MLRREYSEYWKKMQESQLGTRNLLVKGSAKLTSTVNCPNLPESLCWTRKVEVPSFSMSTFRDSSAMKYWEILVVFW
jgi:hypothetical protein